MFVLPEWHVFVVSDLAANCDDTAVDSWNFRGVGQGDSAFGFPFGFILQYQHARSNGFNVLERGAFLWHIGSAELKDQGAQKGDRPRVIST